MDLLGGPLAVVVLVAIAIVLIGVLVWLYRRLGAALTGVVAAVVLVIAGGAFFLRGRAYEHQRFEGAIRPYLAQTGPWQEWAVSIEPVIRGRLLVVDADGKKLHPFHFRLPKEIRPTRPDDIGTVAIQRCAREVVGTYERAGKQYSGYRWSCRLQLLDLGARTTYVSQAFPGSEPPRKARGGDKIGGMPTAKVWAFLMGLPRTNAAPPVPEAPASDSVPMLSPI